MLTAGDLFRRDGRALEPRERGVRAPLDVRERRRMRSNVSDEIGRAGVEVERIRIALAERDGQAHVLTRLGVERRTAPAVEANGGFEKHEHAQSGQKRQPHGSETKAAVNHVNCDPPDLRDPPDLPFDSPPSSPSASRQARSWRANCQGEWPERAKRVEGLPYLPGPNGTSIQYGFSCTV